MQESMPRRKIKYHFIMKDGSAPSTTVRALWCWQIKLTQLRLVCMSCSVVSNSLHPHGLQPARLLCSWDSPGKTTGVGCHFLLQGIFLTQGMNLSILYHRWILYHLHHQGSQLRLDWKPKHCVHVHLKSQTQISSSCKQGRNKSDIWCLSPILLHFCSCHCLCLETLL